MIYFLHVVIVFMKYYASFMMGAWIERHYGDAKIKQDILWVSEWSGVVCGSGIQELFVSLCPMDIGGVDICQRDCQVVSHRYVDL